MSESRSLAPVTESVRRSVRLALHLSQHWTHSFPATQSWSSLTLQVMPSSAAFSSSPLLFRQVLFASMAAIE